MRFLYGILKFFAWILATPAIILGGLILIYYTLGWLGFNGLQLGFGGFVFKDFAIAIELGGSIMDGVESVHDYMWVWLNLLISYLIFLFLCSMILGWLFNIGSSKTAYINTTDTEPDETNHLPSDDAYPPRDYEAEQWRAAHEKMVAESRGEDYKP